MNKPARAACRQPCPAPPLAPAAPMAGGHWQGTAGRDWRPLPAVETEPKRERRRLLEKKEPDGPPDFTDEWGQGWRRGQRLL